MKSILVQTGRDQFHEIYVIVQAGVLARISPSEITKAGQHQVLYSRYDDGGNQGGFAETCFVFTKGGPVRLDFDPVFKAADGVVPKGKRVWFPMSETDFELMEWRVQTNGLDWGKIGCCSAR